MLPSVTNLDALVGAEVEVVLRGVGDVGVHGGASRYVARPTSLQIRLFFGVKFLKR